MIVIATRHVKDWLGNFIKMLTRWNSFKRGIPNYCPQVGEIQHWHDSNPAHRWHSLNGKFVYYISNLAVTLQTGTGSS